MTPEYCPNCGAAVPPKSKACPACGSDDQTGWSDAASGADLPDDTFDYDDYVKREFGQESPVPRGIAWYWWLAAVAVIIGFVLMLIP